MNVAMHSMPARAPRRPLDASRMRTVVFDLVSSRPFDGFIIAIVVANVGLMACDYWGMEQSARSYTIYTGAMAAFSYLYYIECALMTVALSHMVFLAYHMARAVRAGARSRSLPLGCAAT